MSILVSYTPYTSQLKKDRVYMKEDIILSSLPIGYHAPMEVYKAVNSHEVLSYTEQFSGVAEINLCVGKEWHRFPSSFFLPDKRCS